MNVSGRYSNKTKEQAQLHQKAIAALKSLHSELGTWRKVSQHIYQHERQAGNLALVAKNHRPANKDLLTKLGLIKKRVRNEMRLSLNKDEAKYLILLLHGAGLANEPYTKRLEVIIKKSERTNG